MKTLALGWWLLLSCLVAESQTQDSVIARKKYNTNRLSGSITLDGIPSEQAWNTVQWGNEFIQYMPDEGKAPSQPTSFKILYDDRYLYVAYRCFDSAPD